MKLVEFILGRSFEVYNSDCFIPSKLAEDEIAAEAWERQTLDGIGKLCNLFPSWTWTYEFDGGSIISTGNPEDYKYETVDG
ncbi:hypothetical protein KW807_02675 [Candidatus Parcubacteria bacterium]|nr:hypothetical protein [Candidatus Parcubacteria bacterium]